MCSQKQEIFCKYESHDIEKDLGGCRVLFGGDGEGTELPKVLPQAAENNPALREKSPFRQLWHLPGMGWCQPTYTKAD